jgi:hypothetical protein
MSRIAIIKNTDYPEYLCCPINHKLMVEPVIMSDGHSYDKDNIKKWLNKNNKSPLTNEILEKKFIINHNLKKVINEYKENNIEIKKEFYLSKNFCFTFKDNDEFITHDNIKLIDTISGFEFEGSVLVGKLNGQGILKYNTGEIYKGEFLQNKKMDKKGELIYENGDIYHGEFFHNKKRRQGIMKYNNGDIYDGNWLDDQKYKNGIMKYKNGDIYNGEWQFDEKHGIGIIKYKNGDIYDGEWVFDKKHGKGIMTNIEGDKYKGEWDNDKKQGKFEIELKNKDKIFCEFDKDKLLMKNIRKLRDIRIDDDELS